MSMASFTLCVRNQPQWHAVCILIGDTLVDVIGLLVHHWGVHVSFKFATFEKQKEQEEKRKKEQKLEEVPLTHPIHRLLGSLQGQEGAGTHVGHLDMRIGFLAPGCSQKRPFVGLAFLGKRRKDTAQFRKTLPY